MTKRPAAIPPEVALHLSRQLEVALPMLREVTSGGRLLWSTDDLRERYNCSSDSLRSILSEAGIRGRRGARLLVHTDDLPELDRIATERFATRPTT